MAINDKKRYVWTQDELDYIKNNYKIMSDEELATHFGTHSKDSVATKRKQMHLNRSNRKYNFNDVINEFAKTDYILLSDEKDYIDSATNSLRYMCPRHLDKGEMTISLGHLQSGRGCYYCGRKVTEDAHLVDKSINEKECKEMCEQRNFEYIGNVKENDLIYILYICPKHKSAGVQKMRKGNMNRKNIIGCPYCFDTKKFVFSKGEKSIENALNKFSIDYLPQYTFEDCRDKNMLPFDYYLPNMNKCIEFDGQHHYFPVNFNGISDEEALENHNTIIKHDKIKDNYCKEHNIDLLRIPYYEFKNIETLIKDFVA